MLSILFDAKSKTLRERALIRKLFFNCIACGGREAEAIAKIGPTGRLPLQACGQARSSGQLFFDSQIAGRLSCLNDSDGKTPGSLCARRAEVRIEKCLDPVIRDLNDVAVNLLVNCLAIPEIARARLTAIHGCFVRIRTLHEYLFEIL